MVKLNRVRILHITASGKIRNQGEIALVEKIRRRARLESGTDLILGIGDDCAVFRPHELDDLDGHGLLTMLAKHLPHRIHLVTFLALWHVGSP